MSDVEKVALDTADAMFFGPHKPDCEIPEDQTMTVRYGHAVKVIREALAAMGEREAVADDRLAPVREDVIRMRLEALFAEKPIEQWGPMNLATALSPNVEFLVAAAVSNERLRAASPRPEAVEAISAKEENKG